jgi:transglutaminase-like putative cysteine protease
MGDYTKLAVFIVVLLLSVSLMSVAINYLGDISDVELDMEPQSEMTDTSSTSSADSGKGKGKVIRVGGASSGEVFPLFEIRYPPLTKYLRQSVGEAYKEGEWEQYEGHTPVLYVGGDIPLTVTADVNPEPCFVTIKPLFNMSGFIPTMLYVANIEFDGTLERYPSLELFSFPEIFSTTYKVSYALYDFPEAMLLEAKISPMEEYLEVPEALRGRLKALATEIVGDLATPWERLKSIEAYLKGTYKYNNETPPPPPGVDPVEAFLFNGTGGTCGHFNSAFVLLARSLGIPARVVSGFLISPESDYQLVMPKDAHIWAEAPFEELSWITFDATPQREQEGPMEDPRVPTITNITYNSERAIKGGKFTVMGTVTTVNGSAVDEISVELFLTKMKNETGVRCGVWHVEHGFFNITCDAAPSLKVGDYSLVAHALANKVYRESWSDPEIRIMTETQVSIQAPKTAYLGQYITVVGTLVDRSNGKPISNATVLMVVENETGYYTTDAEGRISMTHAYGTEGNKTIALLIEGSRYYIGSNTTFGIAVALRPPPEKGILQLLTTFPYNVILAAGAFLSIGTVVLLTRKQKPRQAQQAVVEASREEEVEKEMPRQFDDQREGIVKLFNWLYAYARRRCEGISDSMTPRELQQALLARIQPSGASALEYLVTAFEIADYSTSRPTQEMLEKCLKAVELLSGMIGHA